MALIGKIRKNSWLLVVLITLGVGGFIFMDMTSGQQSLFGGPQTVVGEVAGTEIGWNKFNRTESLLYGNSSGDIYSNREALWNYFVEEAIVQQEAQALGLGVSKPELMDLQFGSNPSPVIRQRFQDPATGRINRQQLNQFKTAIENGTLGQNPQMVSYWAHQEKEIIKTALQSKLSDLVTKGLYTPTWMVEMGHMERNQRIDFAYVKVPFDELDNSEVVLSDEDLESFLEEHRAEYEQEEETRELEYVVFNVEPTAKDSSELRARISENIPDFRRAEDDSLYAVRNDGQFDPAYLKQSEVSAAIADTVFQMPLGAVYGPYQDGDVYRAVKVIDRMVVPDSVRARHILRSAQNPTQMAQARKTIDSLKTVIESGQGAFDSLATQFGEDNTRSKGGDLGYAFPGQMVKPFNDLIFYQAKVGELYTIQTQFGVHLVEVMDKKYIENEEGIQLAFLEESIIPSEETQNDIYDDVLEFVSQNRTLESLRASADEDPSLVIATSPELRRNDFIVGQLGGGQASRDLVRWAFKAEVGEVSANIYAYQDPAEYFDNKYVVAGLSNIQEAGLPNVADVEDDIRQQVINRKKGELIKERISSQDMSAIAAQYETAVDTIKQVSFSQNTVGNLGQEPKVIAAAFSLEVGNTSQPVIGQSGVYVLQTLRKPNIGPPTGIPQLRQTLASSVRAQAQARLLQAMRENASIEDNRSDFY